MEDKYAYNRIRSLSEKLAYPSQEASTDEAAELQKLEKKYKFYLSTDPDAIANSGLLKARDANGNKVKVFIKNNKNGVVQYIKDYSKPSETYDPIEFMHYMNDCEAMLMLGVDGLPLVIEYDGGFLQNISIPFDEDKGQRVTCEVLNRADVPIRISYEERLVIRCMFTVDVNWLTKIVDNPVARERNLSIVETMLDVLKGWFYRSLYTQLYLTNVIEGLGDIPQAQKLLYLESIGFRLARYELLSKKQVSDKDYLFERMVFFQRRSFENKLPSKILYLIPNDSNGKEQFGFHYGVKEYETVVTHVHYRTNMHGKVVLYVQYEPVEVDGRIYNSSVTDSLGAIQLLNIQKGNRIVVSRADAHSMAIVNNKDNNCVQRKLVCSSCGSELESDSHIGATLRCNNKECKEQVVQHIVRYCSKKGVNIKGFDYRTVSKLYDAHILKSIKGIYELEKKIKYVEATGIIKYIELKKLITSVNNAIPVNLYNYLYALGVEGVKYEEILAASNYLQHNFVTMFKMFEINRYKKDRIKYVADEGRRSYLIFKEWYQDERNRYLIDSTMFHVRFKNTPYQAVSEELFDRTFYIYGDLKTIKRKRLVEIIEELGGRVEEDAKKVNEIDCCICGLDSTEIDLENPTFDGLFLIRLAESGVELMYETQFVKEYIDKN